LVRRHSIRFTKVIFELVFPNHVPLANLIIMLQSVKVASTLSVHVRNVNMFVNLLASWYSERLKMLGTWFADMDGRSSVPVDLFRGNYVGADRPFCSR